LGKDFLTGNADESPGGKQKKAKTRQ